MDVSLLSFLALVVVITINCFSKVNVGILSLALVWVIGYYFAGMTAGEIMAGFPTALFLTLFGVTYLFGLAKINGTLDYLTLVLVRLIKGKRIFFPVILFFLAMVLSTAGVGNIATVALLAPVAMTMASQIQLNGFFTTVIIVTGANAGTFSPFALTGIIANGLIARLNIAMDPWKDIYWPNFALQSTMALIFYFVFIFAAKTFKNAAGEFSVNQEPFGKAKAFNPAQIKTVLGIMVFIIGVAFFKADVGFWAICVGGILTILKAAKGEEAVMAVPWNIIMMVCGVSTLIALMEKTGGMDLFVNLLAKISTKDTVTAVMAFVVGVVSLFSSSSGVVMPAFIPTVPELIKTLGGGDPVAIVASINVGSHAVDVSPLSTLGALCLVSAAHYEDRNKLFHQLLFFGFLMSFVGALVCYVYFQILR